MPLPLTSYFVQNTPAYVHRHPQLGVDHLNADANSKTILGAGSDILERVI